MADRKQKLLFIPTDNISLRISRSYYLAKGLADRFELFFVDWNDVMDAIWAGGRGSAWNSLACFTGSLARPLSIRYDERDGFSRAIGPVAQTAFIRKFVGDYYAYQFMRWVNRKTLKRFLQTIDPDIVFFADGFFLFPWVPMRARAIADMQDDFDETRPRISASEIRYQTENYSHTFRNYAVSQPTADRLGALYSTQFQALPNGADFATIRGVTPEQIQQLRTQLELAGKTVVTFIGTNAKYDGDFLRELALACDRQLPQIHFVIVGNVPSKSLPNVTFAGAKPPAETALYYRLSDIGIILTDTRQSKFLYHSVPLKMIQYAAARKPAVSYPVAWAEDLPVRNLAIVERPDTEVWVQALQQLQQFEWGEAEEQYWQQYDWAVICDRLADEISAGL
ncbi:glycosyltransferase family 4 protein [Synechococcus sp. PCC 7336]|uniref:glycosyltransferase family 4 protein n=1 Tax=Synechococcus sp. PCC 7336 TaxID=195250 RepID=UPI0003450571|nr:glycosyltransferase family 4 protein [Synechococcus sp. PCC 7336]